MFHIVIHYTSLYSTIYLYTSAHTHTGRNHLRKLPETPHLLEHRTERAPTENRAREKEDLKNVAFVVKIPNEFDIYF